MKIRNPLIIRLLIIFGITIVVTIVLFFTIRSVVKSKDELAYDLGEYGVYDSYNDVILKNYDDYKKLVKKYKISADLTAADFQDHYVLASFQDYDECGEERFKEVVNVDVSNAISITFNVHNKCGWCKRHAALHLIKLDEFDGELSINYTYNFLKKLECKK